MSILKILATALPCTYELYPVNSSVIVEVGYHKFSNTLYVQMRNNSVYKYLDFSRGSLAELLSAESVGQHFNSIKGDYKCVKMC